MERRLFLSLAGIAGLLGIAGTKASANEPFAKSGMLWVKVRAIVADEANCNNDVFPREALVEAYKTFEGVPVYPSQASKKDVGHSVGKVVSARWVSSDNSVHCVLCVDRSLAPALAKAIEEGHVTGVAMSTYVGRSKCGKCGEEFHGYDGACDHLRGDKVKDGVVEMNYDLKFMDLCFAVDPASHKCRVLEVIHHAPGMMK